MEIIQAIILGIIQGITEWIPVSSQSVVAFVSNRFFSTDATSFAVWLHIGTMLAGAVYFRNELYECIKFPKMAYFISLSIIFTGVSVFLAPNLEFMARWITISISILLIIIGIWRIKNEIPDKKINEWDGIPVGLAQGISVLPLVSRLGITFTSLMLLKYKVAKALELSFIAGIFASAGAVAMEVLSTGITFSYNYLIGAAFSFIFGLIGIIILFKIVKKVPEWAVIISFGILALVPLFL